MNLEYDEDEYGDKYETPWSTTEAERNTDKQEKADTARRQRTYEKTGYHRAIPEDYHNDGGKEIGWGD